MKAKKRRYACNYKGENYTVLATCEQDAYFKVLERNGIFDDSWETIINNKMEINITI